MALARIISRSHQCSRELALDLFARGYTVEIVSPDKIPDNVADLVLRVDTGPSDRLTATVEVHHGQRSASFEFVHHLKAPMADPVRRPLKPPESARPEVAPPVVRPFVSPEVARPEIGPLEVARPEVGPLEVVRFSDPSIRSNAEPRILEPTISEPRISKERIEDLVLPAAAPLLAPEIVSAATGVPPVRELDPYDRLPAPVEPPTYFAVEDASVAPPTIAPPSRPMPSLRLRDRSVGWRWRTALAFAGVVGIAVALVFGMRRSNEAASQSSAAGPVEKIAAASSEMFPGAAYSGNDAVKERGQVSSLVSPRSAVKSPKQAPVSKAATATASRRAPASRTHGDSLIARNTVTYLDQRFAPRPFNKSAPKVKPKQSLARRRSSVHKHGAVIAANEVTYLHSKPTPKPAK